MTSDNEKGPPGDETLGGLQDGATAPESYAGNAETATPRYEESLAFLKWAQPNGPWCLAYIPVGGGAPTVRTFWPGQEKQVLDWLRENSKHNLYFHVNPVRDDFDKKPAESDMLEMAWLHCDIDPRKGKDLEEERKKIDARLMDPPAGIPRPSCTIDSGRGMWGLWRLEKPVPIDGNADDLKRRNLHLELVLGGDGCHNLDRLARLPGSINHKTGRLAQVVHRDEVRFPLQLFEPAAVVDAPRAKAEVKLSGEVVRVTDLLGDPRLKELRPEVRRAIAQGCDPDDPDKHPSRSEWLWWVCCAMVRAGIDDDTIYAAITDPVHDISKSVLEQGSRTHEYAVRQIKRAREEAVHPMLRQLNEKYALVESIGGKTRVMRQFHDPAFGHDDIEFLLVDGFQKRYCNQFVTIMGGKDGKTPIEHPAGKWWLSHPMRRTYETVTFVPGADLPPHYLNLWQGFKFDPAPGKCDLFLAHLRDNVCNGNREQYDYLLRWMARAVQQPAEPGHVAIVLRGKKGAGKGFVVVTFGELWGRHFKHITNPDHVIGNFNAQLKDGTLVFADECFVPNSKKHESSLKTLITERRISLELKGVDARQWPNCTKLMMSSNDDWVVPASHDERRYFVLDVGDAQLRNSAYFSAIEQQMKGGGYAALLHMLRTMDLSDFDVRVVPDTAGLRDQKEHTLEGTREEWLLSLLEAGMLPNNVNERPNEAFSTEITKGAGDGLVEHARRTVPNLRDKSERYFMVFLSKKWGATGSDGGKASWTFPPLAEMRRLWCAKHGQREWPGGSEAVWQRCRAF